MKRLVFLAILTVVVSLLAQPLRAQEKGKAKAMTTMGTVKTVTNNSVTITANGKEMSFSIDPQTTFIGKGLSTKAREKGKMTATDSVGVNDQVRVSYNETSGNLHATEIRIINKAKK
jgi:hypothetical protein